MKVKNKILILVIGVLSLCMIAIPNNVNAALQANGTTSKTDTMNNWLLNIRKMEATGGTLGLTDSINTTSLVSAADKSNNLDIHMEKNTEYGAVAILSASAYGNQNVIANGGTTTGNKTGLVINIGTGEWVAAGATELGDSVANFKNSVGKYKNIYETSYVAKKGDAINETYGWHGSKSKWLTVADASQLMRAYEGGIFSYNGYVGNGKGYAHYTFTKPTRAVIVIGNGF